MSDPNIEQPLNQNKLPLSGLVVLDLSRLLPGPYCSMTLADLGAEVICIEDPSFPFSSPPPYYQNGKLMESAFRHALYRNKKSISLNFSKEGAKELFIEMVKQADIILESFRPGVTKKLGIDYITVSAINPKIIYASLTGYGQTGPYKSLPGHDLNYMSISGNLALNHPRKILHENEPPSPVVPGIQSADIGGALFTAIGILSAIIARNQNPNHHGQYIDVAMLDCVFAMNPVNAAYMFPAMQMNANPNQIIENMLHGDMPFYTVYRTKDNQFLSIGCIEDKFWRGLCEGIGKPEFIADQFPSGEARERRFHEMQAIFLTKTQQEWMDIFEKIDTCVMPVKTFKEACEDTQIQARQMVKKKSIPNLDLFSK